MVRLTALLNASRDVTNCSVGIVMGRPCNRFAGATVTSDKPRERDNRLVTDLGVGIRGQHFDEVSYNIADANIPVTAPLTGETMQSAVADRGDGIAQSLAKRVRGPVAGVMIQQEQAEAPHRQIRVTECCDLHSRDWHLPAERPTAFLREREPSMDKITRDLEVGPHSCTQTEQMVSEKGATFLRRLRHRRINQLKQAK
jgi:hypothetical protein